MPPTNYGRDFYLLGDYGKIAHYIEKNKTESQSHSINKGEFKID